MNRPILFVLATLSLTGNAFAGHSEPALASSGRFPVQVSSADPAGVEPGRGAARAADDPLGGTASHAGVPPGSPIDGPYVMGEKHYAPNGSMLVVAKEIPVVSKDEWDSQCSGISGRVVGAGLGFCVLAVGDGQR